jgi:hypothetical protein
MTWRSMKRMRTEFPCCTSLEQGHKLCLYLLNYFLWIVIKMAKWVGMKWVRHIARTEKVINAREVLLGKPELKKSIGRTRPWWVDNIKIDVQETLCEDVDGMCVTQGQCLVFNNLRALISAHRMNILPFIMVSLCYPSAHVCTGN